MSEYMPEDNGVIDFDEIIRIQKGIRMTNILLSAGLILVAGLGSATVVTSIRAGKETSRTRTAVEALNRNVAELGDEVYSLSKDVDTIAEWYCDGDDEEWEEYNPIFSPLVPTVDKPNIYLYPETDDKPVIYLYGEEPLVEAHVHLTLTSSELTASWPQAGMTSQSQNKVESWWDVYAAKDGTIYDAEGYEYSYIFWEATDYGVHDFSEGFCVAGSDTGEFLRSALSEIGLTPQEYNEFIVYWLPRMQNNAYNLITFEGLNPDDEYNKACQLEVTDSEGNPADSMLRVMMAWKALDAPIEITPQSFEPFQRVGFTVVEWGGTKLQG